MPKCEVGSTQSFLSADDNNEADVIAARTLSNAALVEAANEARALNEEERDGESD